MKNRGNKKSIGSNTSESETSIPQKHQEEFPSVEVDVFVKELGELVGCFLAVEDSKREPSR